MYLSNLTKKYPIKLEFVSKMAEENELSLEVSLTQLLSVFLRKLGQCNLI